MFKKKENYQSILIKEYDEALSALNRARDNYNQSDLLHIGIAIRQLNAAEQNFSACVEKLRLDEGALV